MDLVEASHGDFGLMAWKAWKAWKAWNLKPRNMSADVSPESDRVARQYAVPGSFRAKVTTMRSLEAVGSSMTS